MQALAVAAVLLTQALAGLVLLPAVELTLPGRLARGLLLGPLAIALQMATYHVAGVPFTPEAVLLPWWLAGALRWRHLRASLARDSRGSLHGALALALASAVFLWILGETCRVPVYHGDEVSNFAFTARLFELKRDLAPGTLAGLFGKGTPEYPPLIALNEALLFQVEAGQPGYAVKPFFALAWLAWALLAVELVQEHRGSALALPAGILAIAVPELVEQAMGGKGDVRLVATWAWLLIDGQCFLRGERKGALVRFLLVGAAAVACAWTKREGLALGTLAVAVLAPAAVRRLGPLRTAVSTVLVLGLAWTWRGFKAWHGIRESYEVRLELQSLFSDLGRSVVGMFRTPLVSDFGPHRSWHLLAIAAAAAVLVGLRSSRTRRVVLALSAGLTAHCLLYALAFAATPFDLDWQIRTASPRFLLHLLPWLVLLLFAAIAGNEAETAPSPDYS